MDFSKSCMLYHPVKVTLLLVGLVVGSGSAQTGQAQAKTASHTVTITVEEVNRIEVGEDIDIEVEQGQSKTASSSYSVLANTSNPRVIQASVETEGNLVGIGLTAEMEAPGDGSTSRGERMIVEDGEEKTKVLVEGIEGVDASDAGLTYVVAASGDAPPGTASVLVTYTIISE